MSVVRVAHENSPWVSRTQFDFWVAALRAGAVGRKSGSVVAALRAQATLDATAATQFTEQTPEAAILTNDDFRDQIETWLPNRPKDVD